MKTNRLLYGQILMYLIAIVMFFPMNLFSQSENNDDKTLSPYFFIKSDDQSLDQMPLQKTSAEVNIAGVIADVNVTQVYKNEGKKPIEAIYVFPASSRAAVYAMKMTIGERTIIAKIEEKQKARQEYEKAKKEGKSASLLEQKRPNVFQMNVANIMPGDIIKVELSYTELIIPEEGVYEFSYPTVVGPRYSNQPEAIASADDKWVSNPYTKEGKQPLYDFNIKTYIKAGLPIKDVKCNSQNVKMSFSDENNVEVSLKNDDKSAGNCDYILQYRLTGEDIGAGLLLYEGEKENFFLAMIQPPARPKVEQIPAREYIFIVDVSGSMSGFPLNISKGLIRNLIGKLRPTDRFNVILFAGTSSVLSEQSIPANTENIKKAINVIDHQRGGGGTQLLPALKRVLEMEKSDNYSRTFVIVTDGYVSVEKEAFDLIRSNLNKANFFSFGIGSSVNRFIIEGMAHVGNGEPFIVTNSSDAKQKAEKFRKYIQSPVLTNIKTKFDGFDVYDVEPLNSPDVFAEKAVLIFGKWKNAAKGSITLTGLTGNDIYEKTLSVSKIKPLKSNIALKYLWAREKIRLLDDYNNIRKDQQKINEVIELGLKYNLLTQYTSFLAIDSEVRNNDGSLSTVNQPLPLPVGVSNAAVGAKSIARHSNRSYNKVSSMANNELIEVDFESDIVVEDNLQIIMKEEIIAEPDEEETEIFRIVEEYPEFIGGEDALKEFIKRNFVYPQIARENMIKGTVYISFVIQADGSLTNIKVLRGIGGGCDAEAVRLVKAMNGKWKPGKQRGKAVAVRFTIPVKFNIE